MSLRLIADSTSPSATEDNGGETPPTRETPPISLTELLRSGEALVWWDHKITISWFPICVIQAASLGVFIVAGLVVPELWSANLATLLKPLGVLSLPAAALVLREYFSRCTLALTDQAVLSIDAQGRSHRLALGDIVATARDILTGGITISGRMDSILIPTALLEPARLALANQLRVRTSAIRFQEIDDRAQLLPRRPQRPHEKS